MREKIWGILSDRTDVDGKFAKNAILEVQRSDQSLQTRHLSAFQIKRLRYRLLVARLFVAQLVGRRVDLPNYLETEEVAGYLFY